MARFERLAVAASVGAGELIPNFLREQLIRDEERDRLSRELHDSTSQLLVALRLKMAGLTRFESGPVSEETLSQLYSTIDDLHNQIRAISFGCGSLIIEGGGLPLALQQMIDQFAVATDMDVTFKLSQPYVEMPRPMKVAAYRVVQEALANARRHGDARAALVQLRSNSQQVMLRIKDDGLGIPSNIRMGCGLRNMRDRASMLGGKLRIRRLSRGTMVELVIPREPADS